MRWLLLYPVAIFICLEVAFRILGYAPFTNDDYSIQSTPKNAFVGDSLLGIQLHPGTYTIQVNKGLSFQTQHLDNHSRHVSGRQQTPTDVLLLGCSFTYGFGVNDDQTFASLLQQAFPEMGIQNAGVIGYGSVQSLMQLKSALETEHLKVVLLHFSSFHFMRNTLSQQYRSNLKIGYHRSSQDVDNLMTQARFPFISRCSEPITYEPWASLYANWPCRDWLATVNAIQTTVDLVTENPAKQRTVTACILQQMHDLCHQKGVAFGVVCLDATAETAQLKQSLNDVPWLDVHFDFNNKTLTNQPYDSHPNPAGHQRIAQAIEPFLAGLLHEN
ncbi:MAG: SGNH/GDSL hydrolase family protein [Lewinellaceae bacterium]|nr:SGNH/GDSL hydrolase family protein [Lewinellaceae bacterium]